MARIRTIKPEFWTSEQITECSMRARLLFIGIWNFADDSGIHPDSLKRLKMQIFPADDITTEGIGDLVDELIHQDLLERYEVNDRSWLLITGWDNHQKINRPTYRYPLQDGSVPTHGDINEPSPPEGKGKDGKGKEGNGREWSLRSSDRGDQKEIAVDSERLPTVRARFAKIANRLGGIPARQQDRSLLAKVAALSTQAGYSEHWLMDAIEGLDKVGKKPINKFSWLHKCWGNSAAKLKRNFNQDLARVSLNHDAMSDATEVFERAKEPEPP